MLPMWCVTRGEPAPISRADATDLAALTDYAQELAAMRGEDVPAMRPTNRAVYAVAATEYARLLNGSWAPLARAEARRLADEFTGLAELAVASLAGV